MQIADYLEPLAGSALFRGQDQHHVTDDSEISFSPSFRRLACVPTLMFRWTYYAQSVLRALQGPEGTSAPTEYVQAILQHYGWRSFFLDVSASSFVASWFAGHRYSRDIRMEMTEDCFETPIILGHLIGDYEKFNGEGHLYVFRRKLLTELNFGLVDLEAITINDNARYRFAIQKAWLIGPLTKNLPGHCAIAHVSAPAKVFREYASFANLDSIHSVFPDRSEDPILDLLLSVPWEIMPKIDNRIEGYVRGLQIPEYDFKDSKRYTSKVAFFRPFWIADNRGPKDSPFSGATFIRMPQDILFARRENTPIALPRLYDLLREKKSIAVEANGLLAYPEFSRQVSYGKGVFLILEQDKLVQVCEISVDYEGRVLSGAGITRGWFYEIQDSGDWKRTPYEGECPCNNRGRHEQHLVMAFVADSMLREGDLIKNDDSEYIHKELISQESNGADQQSAFFSRDI